jgi:hypothetical protein
MSMARSIKASTKAFLIVLAITIGVWVLRGFGILTFLPGWVLLLLMLLSVATAILTAVR